MTPEAHLKIAGALQILLGLAHAFFPRRFSWGEELPRLSLFNRQMFRVHAFFIAFIVVMFGVLSLGFTSLLVGPESGGLAKVVLGGLCLFWMVRLFVQFFVYDPALWRGHRFNTAMHLLFSALWVYLTVCYGWAFARVGVGS